jgi:hypothetical protein
MQTAAFRRRTIVALAIAIFSGIASAQVRLSASNTVTVGGDAGPLYIEGDPVKKDFFGTASAAAHVEYYYNPRVSLGGSFGYAGIPERRGANPAAETGALSSPPIVRSSNGTRCSPTRRASSRCSTGCYITPTSQSWKATAIVSAKANKNPPRVGRRNDAHARQ